MLMTKIEALAKHLDMTVEDVEAENRAYGDGCYELRGATYLVCTAEEADEQAADNIRDSLWAFNTDFIIEHSDLPPEAKEMITSFQESKCEDANDTIKALIKDEEEFIDDALAADGRGHFLSSYDGEEHEVVDPETKEAYYIYRTN